MAEGHDRRLWNHTAQLLCGLAEPWRDRDQHPEPFQPAEFNPYLQAKADEPRRRLPRMKVSVLKGIFVDK